MTNKSVLFVCSGNICRSPTAEGLMRHYAKQHGYDIRIDSAGTHGLHEGEPPDERAVSKALENGIDIKSLRARKTRPDDFETYDLILGLDSGHVQQLKAGADSEHKAKIHLFLEYAGHPDERDVPDPYYGGADHFDNAYRLIDEGVRFIINRYGS